MNFSEGKPTFENPVDISMEDYRTFTNSHYGLCLACGNLNESFHEPDAENYPCENCEEWKSMGLEMAFVAGYLSPGADEEEEEDEEQPAPETKGSGSMELTKRELRAILAFTADDPTRANLMHPAFVRAWGERWLAATDGHAIVAMKLPINFHPNEYNKPISSLTAAYKLTGRKKGETVTLWNTGTCHATGGITEPDKQDLDFPGVDRLTSAPWKDGYDAVPVAFSGRLLARLGHIQAVLEDEDREAPELEALTVFPARTWNDPVEFQSTRGRWLVLIMPMRCDTPPNLTGGI